MLTSLDVGGQDGAGEEHAAHFFLFGFGFLNPAEFGQAGGLALHGLALLAFGFGELGRGFAAGDIGGEGGLFGFFGPAAGLALGGLLLEAELFEALGGEAGLFLGGEAGGFGLGLFGAEFGESGGGFFGFLVGLQGGEAVGFGLGFDALTGFGFALAFRALFGGQTFGLDLAGEFGAVAPVGERATDQREDEQDNDDDILFHGCEERGWKWLKSLAWTET